MKKNVTAAVGLIVLACATGAAAAITTFHTTLRNPGPNDPPGIVACGSAVGSGTFSYDDSTHTLSGNLTFTPAPATTAILYGPPSNYLHPLNCGSSPCSVGTVLLSSEQADLLASKDIAFLQTSGQPPNIAGYIVNDDGGVDSCEVDAGKQGTSDAGAFFDAGASSDAAVPDAGTPPNELMVASCSSGTGRHPTGGALFFVVAGALLFARRRLSAPCARARHEPRRPRRRDAR